MQRTQEDNAELDLLYLIGQTLYERATRELQQKLGGNVLRPHMWIEWWQAHQPMLPSRTWSLCAQSMAHYLESVPHHFRGRSAARWLRDAAIRCEHREQLRQWERTLPLPLRGIHDSGRA